MKLHFKKIRYKNILSSGNSWTEIDLDSHKSTLIVGKNGNGKSQMMDALSFALYNKPFRKINKPQLVNSINNKDAVVELEFYSNNHLYFIKRGLKPNIFEVYKNGELINQDSASKDYQKHLEENILKMNFKSFTQIVVLGSSTFVPFMQLPAHSRREVIEDLLDIQIFTMMNSLLKEKIIKNKSEIQENQYQIDLCKNQLESAKSHNESIRKLKTQEVGRIKNKIREQLKLIENENNEIKTLQQQVKEIESKTSDKDNVYQKIREIEKHQYELKHKRQSIYDELSFYEDHSECPTCKQDIEESFKQTVIERKGIDKEKLQSAIEQLEEKLSIKQNRKKEIESTEKEIQNLNINISEHRANIKFAKTNLKQLKKEHEQAEKEASTVDLNEIRNIEKQLSELNNNYKELSEHREALSVTSSLLKDGGIKTQIIKQYVPIMNKIINKYLAMMDFFVEFELDESFNETIRSRYRDSFSYSSFSEGEKLRIDLSLLLTWRAISKMRSSVSTNLLIMDEIMDSSLDNSGTDELLKILNELTNDSNVFIISHKGDTITDKFERILKVEKIKNFSVMTVEE